MANRTTLTPTPGATVPAGIESIIEIAATPRSPAVTTGRAYGHHDP